MAITSVTSGGKGEENPGKSTSLAGSYNSAVYREKNEYKHDITDIIYDIYLAKCIYEVRRIRRRFRPRQAPRAPDATEIQYLNKSNIICVCKPKNNMFWTGTYYLKIIVFIKSK
jgi:hypothetical protein